MITLTIYIFMREGWRSGGQGVAPVSRRSRVQIPALLVTPLTYP